MKHGAEKHTKMKPAQASMPSHAMKMSPEKAGMILEHGEVHGKPLTKKQKGLFGARRGMKD